MAVETATGVLEITSGGSVGSTFSVTGLSFQPKALLVWWSGRTEGSDTVGAVTLLETRQGFGFATGPSNRFCVGFAFDRKTARTDALIATLSNITISDGRIDFDSFLSDGFRLIIDDALPVALRVSWLALGGSTLSAVANSFSYTSGTGDLDISGVGFQPDALFCMMPNATSSETFTGDMHFGFAAGATPDNITWSSYGSGASYCKSGECFSVCESIGTGVVGRGAISQWQSDGFRINRISDLGATRTGYYLALKGGSYKVGSFATRTDGNDITISPGFSPKALFAISACRAESTGGTSSSKGEVSAGAFTSTSSRNAQGVFHDLVTDSQTIIEYDAFYAHIDTTPAIVGLADVTTVASPVTAVMDDADNAANFVGYFAIGDPTVLTATVNQVSETDTSQSLTHVKVKTLGQASETDTAQALTVPKIRLITQVGELDLAQSLTAASLVTLGQAFEIDQALALLGPDQTLLLRQAQEIDLAQQIYATIDPLPDRPVFLDSAVVREVIGPLTEITGLDHLNGLRVCVVLDGRIHDTSYVVTSGTITLNTPVLQKIEVGLCYDGELWTMRPGVKDQQIEGLPRSWATLGLLVKQSYGGFVRLGNSNVEVPIREGDRSYNIQPLAGYTRLFTGDVSLTPDGESELDGRIKIRVPTPAPFTVLALYGDLEIGKYA